MVSAEQRGREQMAMLSPHIEKRRGGRTIPTMRHGSP